LPPRWKRRAAPSGGIFLRESEDFAVTEAFVSAVDEETDMVFLCQPNNPTGQLTSLPLVEALPPLSELPPHAASRLAAPTMPAPLRKLRRLME